MFVSFPQDYVDHAIIAITGIIKHEVMIMINQSTKGKGSWSARIFGTLYRLSKTYGRMDKKTKTCKCIKVSTFSPGRKLK